MIGGNSKFLLTCTHTRVPAHTHTQHTSRNKKKRDWLAKWGSGLTKKELSLVEKDYLSIFPSVDTLAWVAHALAVACLGSTFLGRGKPWQPWHSLGSTCLGLGSPCLGHGIAMATHGLALAAHVPAFGVRISSASYHQTARNLKNTKMKEGEIKSLIKTERSRIAFAILGTLRDRNRDICT
jgi:hypothetical protein